MWRISETHSFRGSRGGSWRARGRGRVSHSYEPRTRGGWSSLGSPPTLAASPEPPLGPLLSSLTKDKLDQETKDHEPKCFITDLKTVASYNWLDRTEPTIIVPGKPPRWTPLSTPRRLNLDVGEYYRDPNAANFPKHPMEPTIVAAVTMQPSITRQTDVVACGSTISNLLRFLEGEDKPFRMLVELVDETVFLIRRENTPRELIPDVQGYGHSFPEAYTTWDSEVKGATSHQRVIAYRFGGLGFLVRHSGDGYIADDDADEGSASKLRTPSDSDVGAELEHLSTALAGNRVTSKLPEDTHTGLKVLRAGELVSQSQIFELKTRSVKKKDPATLENTLSEQIKRLWVAQIPNFILAYHTRGVFDEVNVSAVQEEVDDWERSHVDMLSRLAALIDHIISLVRARTDKKLELRHSTVGILEVREQLADAGDALSKNGRVLWQNSGDQVTRDDSSSDVGDGWGDQMTRDDSFSVDGDVWDDGFEPDFTACSAEDCGYCGRCSY